MGPTAVGLLLTWLVIQPFYSVPNAFGMLIETGFAGGHGTAAAMGQIFATPEIAFPVGLDLGLLMATAGLVYGTVSGIVWINVMVRMGWVQLKAQTPINEPADENPLKVVLAAEIAPADARSVKRAENAWDVSRRFLLQSFWIAAAFAIGMTLRSGVGAIAEGLDSAATVESSAPVGKIEGPAITDPRSPVLQKLRWVSLLGSFPLFIYTLIGGGIVGRALTVAGRAGWMDGRSGAIISGWAMDLLVVAAITTLDLQAVATYWVPMTLLFLGGAVWSAFCLLVLSRRILPQSHWFELGLINYGMSTGTTATGFVLLRLVDPQLRTDAAKHYAFAAPLSAPMVGGGLVTIGLPLLLLQRLPIAASALAISVFVAGLIVVALRLGRNQ
jgi:ESS family glutamate:Na+ symporter